MAVWIAVLSITTTAPVKLSTVDFAGPAERRSPAGRRD
jgi:hypothetical protein